MKEKSRTPMSQQALTIEKPTLEDGIGSKVTVEINEKKVQVFLDKQFLMLVKKIKFMFLHSVIILIFALRGLVVFALLKLKE